MILILSTEFYPKISSALEKAVTDVLRVAKEPYEIVRVPGAIELPIAAQRILREKRHDIVITLGCVIKGETDHYEMVLRSCTDGLTRVALDESVPIIQGVLACRNEKQAEMRKTRKGKEFAKTALAMKSLFKSPSSKKIAPGRLICHS